jgi:hypothetical protein
MRAAEVGRYVNDQNQISKGRAGRASPSFSASTMVFIIDMNLLLLAIRSGCRTADSQRLKEKSRQGKAHRYIAKLYFCRVRIFVPGSGDQAIITLLHLRIRH